MIFKKFEKKELAKSCASSLLALLVVISIFYGSLRLTFAQEPPYGCVFYDLQGKLNHVAISTMSFSKTTANISTIRLFRNNSNGFTHPLWARDHFLPKHFALKRYSIEYDCLLLGTRWFHYFTLWGTSFGEAVWYRPGPIFVRTSWFMNKNGSWEWSSFHFRRCLEVFSIVGFLFTLIPLFFRHLDLFYAILYICAVFRLLYKMYSVLPYLFYLVFELTISHLLCTSLVEIVCRKWFVRLCQKERISETRFRSADLWVMSPARLHCAISLFSTFETAI